MPIIETQAGDVSAFVPTNVISITDGQIFLESSLFSSGLKPAMDPGISVSRVGGAAQVPIIKKLGGGIKTALAQYRELEAFAQFASDLDEASKEQLEHGERVTELTKQDQFSPMSVAEMGLMLFTANEGFLREVEVEKIVEKIVEVAPTKEKREIVFGGLNWDSALVQNGVARYIVEHGYGYPTSQIEGSTLPLFRAFVKATLT